MAAAITSPKGAAGFPQAVKPPRMRAPLAKAIDLIATKGKTQMEASSIVGMDHTSLSRALGRPEVRAYLEARKSQFSLDADTLKGMARALAIHTGIDLMNNSTSDQVKARMVEFFAGDPRQALVNIAVNAPPPQGYTYTKPASTSRPPDSVSGVEDAQVIDNTEQSDER